MGPSGAYSLRRYPVDVSNSLRRYVSPVTVGNRVRDPYRPRRLPSSPSQFFAPGFTLESKPGQRVKGPVRPLSFPHSDPIVCEKNDNKNATMTKSLSLSVSLLSVPLFPLPSPTLSLLDDSTFPFFSLLLFSTVSFPKNNNSKQKQNDPSCVHCKPFSSRRFGDHLRHVNVGPREPRPSHTMTCVVRQKDR